MNSLSYFLSSTKNETVKLKRTFAFWLSVIGAFFIPLIYLLYYLLKYEKLIPKEGENPWDSFMTSQITAASPLLIPMFIILVTSLIVQIEHKSLSVKHLFTLPIPKWSVYFGKLFIVLGLVLFTYVLFALLVFIVGYTVGGVHGELQMWEHTPNVSLFVKLLFRSFISVLGIIGLQFWLSFRFKNFIVPLGIGMVLFITGLIVYQAKESIYYPYAYSMLSLFPLDSKDVNAMVWFPRVALYSIGYFLLFSVLGFLDIRRMNIK
ncbi:ABC transporter permease subunit [Leptobacterium flavescens]|uniref:ABC transporter permease subunit n=1 Tax=Leptobacterium flavescens TaxID=472055 RepID=A0A6P0UMU5_9FLAO|nr:ABC transporter permease [Leptobacterium flavescens]NER14584.1 ABC transporter permease subunit [Leptobacterium flavescens]